MTKRPIGKSKRRKSTGGAGPAEGPITLAQARTLAGAVRTAPKRQGVQGARALSAPQAPPIALGAERVRLEREQDLERQLRIREYTATLGLLKQRGVKGLGPKTKGAKAKAFGAPAPRPLQAFAEGDSWFHYPVPLFGGGVISRLEDKLGVPILNLAQAGDEVRFMLGVKQRKLLTEQLKKGCPAGGPWDALLFSGGGNDIVDNPMALWIRDYDATASPEELLNQPRFDAALALLRAGYEDLIALRDRWSPNTHLFFHAYDYAIPDGRKVCHLGPWLKPTFDLRGFPDRNTAFAVTKVMLQRFAAMLRALASAPRRITFIEGQGTLPERTSSWHNELHPSKDGFKAFASLFRHELRKAFPGRVL